MIDACHYAHHKDQITERPSFLSFVLLLLRCCSMPFSFFVSALLWQSLLFFFRNLPQIKSVWFTCLFKILFGVFDMSCKNSVAGIHENHLRKKKVSFRCVLTIRAFAQVQLRGTIFCSTG